MALILTVTAYKGVPLPQPLSKTFDGVGGKIGRATDCELFLNDPEKFVSRQHGAFRYADGLYYLQDISTQNPIRVNQNALGSGKEVKLQDGDTIVIGDYVISVSLSAPLASSLDGFPTLGDAEDSLALAGTKDSLVLRPNVSLSNVDVSTSVADTLDPFKLADDKGILSKLTRTELSDSFDLREPMNPVNLNDHVAPVHEPMQAVNLVPGRIPDDYDPLDDLDLGYSGANNLPRRPVPFSDAVIPSSPEAGARKAGEDTLSDIFGGDDVANPSSQASKLSASIGTALPADSAMLDLPVPPSSRPADMTAYLAEPPSDVGAADRLEPLAHAQDAILFRAFVEGAGLTDLDIPEQQHAQVLRVAGEVVREFVQGSIDVLAARATVKNELRAQRTILSANENNPLKFSPDAHYALTQFFKPAGSAYLPAVQAVREAFDDVKEHELAVIAGLRGAMEGLLRRIDPERLQSQAKEASGLDAVFPNRRKGKLWEQWLDLYKELKAAAGDDFDRLIGSEFVASYEEHLRKGRQRK